MTLIIKYIKHMKTLLKFMVALLLLGCGGNDDNSNTPEENILEGQWRLISGSFYNGADKFAYFNADNTLDILRETNDNFKGNFNTTYTIDDSQITINGLPQSGPISYDYILEDDILALTNDFTSATLQKVTSGAPDLSSWITELTVLEEGNAPWEGYVDIAFSYDKTQILYGTTNDGDYIALIDPNTFNEVGQITTTRSAYAVEVEKFDLPDRYIFMSDNGAEEFFGYYENNINTLGVTSQELGAWITGLASVDSRNIWAASGNESTLYLYDYDTSNIDITIPIQVNPLGLDYQNDMLYVSDGNTLHKCQTTPNFEVLESYSIPDFTIGGVAFDGTNFWVNGYDASDDSFKIVKTSLTL